MRHTEFYILASLTDGSLTREEVKTFVGEMIGPQAQNQGIPAFDKLFGRLIDQRYVRSIGDDEFEVTAKGVQAHHENRLFAPPRRRKQSSVP